MVLTSRKRIDHYILQDPECTADGTTDRADDPACTARRRPSMQRARSKRLRVVVVSIQKLHIEQSVYNLDPICEHFNAPADSLLDIFSQIVGESASYSTSYVRSVI